jgi:hypothetical protein
MVTNSKVRVIRFFSKALTGADSEDMATTTCSDSEDMEVRDGLLFGPGSRIYDLS